MGQLPVVAREVARVAFGVALEVVLVLGLRLPEGARLAQLCDQLAGPEPRGIDVGDRVLGHQTLLLGGVEDLRAVVRTAVLPLAVLGGRVVDLEEELQDVPVGDPVGAEDDLDRLGVAGMVPVGRVGVLAAGVSDAGGDDAVPLAKQLLDSPEAPSGEDRSLGVVGHGVAPSILGRSSLLSLSSAQERRAAICRRPAAFGYGVQCTGRACPAGVRCEREHGICGGPGPGRS